MKRRLLILFIIFTILLSNVSYASIGYEDKARSYILADLDSGQILAYYNVDESLEIASTTKLLSYYVAMDAIKEKRASYDDLVVIGEDVTKLTGSTYALKAGEVMTLEKLMKASIIVSANDATYAMAKHIAGSEAEFVNLMKAKAEELGLSNYELYNSSGLPLTNNGIQNKMTTMDLYKISVSLLKTYPEVLEISKIPFISEPSRKFFAMNTNPLLKLVEDVNGLKTGSTIKAGYCFVSTMNYRGVPRRTEDLRLIGIVMGSRSYEDRNEVSKALAQYGKDNYENKIILHPELSIENIELPKGQPDNISLYPEKGLTKLIKKKSKIELDIKLNDVSLPLAENSRLGTVTVMEDGKPIFTTGLVNRVAAKEAEFKTLASKFLSELFEAQQAIFKRQKTM